MKIGFDFRMGGTRNGGIGRYAFELLKNLLILPESSEHTFFIFYRPSLFNPVDNFEEQDNVKWIPADYRHYSLKEQLLLPGLLNKYNLDLVHFPNFNVPVFYKGKFVVTIHDTVHHRLSGHKKSTRIFFEAYKYIIQQAALKSEIIITVSECSKQDIVDDLNVLDDKIEVIYEASSLKSVSDKFAGQVAESLGLSSPYFLAVGVMERKKNLVEILKAFELFLKTHQLDIDLVIAGRSDPHYPEIREEFLRSEARDRIILTGYIEDNVLSALYKKAYAYFSASTNEGFGLPGLEAMSAGVPIVVPDTPVYNEIYSGGAVYFEPHDVEDLANKMYLICRDSKFQEQQQIKSHNRSRDFSWERTARETLLVYESTKKQ